MIGKHFTGVMHIANSISLELPSRHMPHLVVYAVIVVLLKIVWDLEQSGQPLAGTDLPPFEEWAHAMHAHLAHTAPLISAPCAFACH